MNISHHDRRRFLLNAGMSGAQATLSSWNGFSRSGGRSYSDAGPRTPGPFYPKPQISEQEFYDADLTRKSLDGPVAEGEIIVVQGRSSILKVIHWRIRWSRSGKLAFRDVTTIQTIRIRHRSIRISSMGEDDDRCIGKLLLQDHPSRQVPRANCSHPLQGCT